MKLYILGGRPCSGKTTYAYHLGKRNNVEVMYLDVFAHEQSQQASDIDSQLYKWKTVDMIDILQDDPKKLFNDYLLFYEELFPMFLDYIMNSDKESLIIESSMLLPKYVKLLEKEFEVQVTYLQTTDEFVRTTYPKRDYALEMLKSEKGEKALHNLLERDVIFSKYLYEQAIEYGYNIIKINRESEFENTFYEVEKYFKF